jgi:RNA polymerase sigma factor (sigma-70 family)
MSTAPPAVLSRLLDTQLATSREGRWGDFVGAYSRLIMHVARSFGGEYDAKMDRYAFILDHLQRDDYRRLRTFVADGRSEFTTWLVVVAQRLCRDHQRHRYGRLRTADRDAARSEQDLATRRQLVDLIGAEIDLSTLSDDDSADPESVVRIADTYAALDEAIAQLEKKDQLLIRLRFEDDLPIPDIARALGFPTRFHAYRRLTYVLDRLRHALVAQGIVEAAP